MGNTFSVDDEVLVSIPEFVTKDGQVFPAEEFRGRVTKPYVHCMISRLPGMEVSMPDGGTAHIDPAWATLYVKPVRTPLTWDNLYAWAEKFVGKEHASAESVLVDLLIAHDAMNFEDYKAYELREAILDLHKNGTIGYTQMGRDDLRKECEKRFLDPDDSYWVGSVGLVDLEGLIEAMGFDMEPEEPVQPSKPEVVLSDAEKAAILDDFVRWSGGFYPRACKLEKIWEYVETQVSVVTSDKKAVEAFLEECRNFE